MHIKTFSRKTVAIALAAGMTLGGVTVAAPMAGAVTSPESAATDASAVAGVTSPTSPFPELKETMTDRTYKFDDAESGSRTLMRVLASPTDIKNGEIRLPGLFAGIPNDEINTISNFYETESSNESFVRGKDYPEISKVNEVKSVRVEENGDFVISLLPGAKRIVNVIDIVLSDHTTLTLSPAVGTRENTGLNFVTKNPDGTISGKLEKHDMSHLVASGGEYVFDIYGFPLLGQEPGVEVEPYDFGDGAAGELITGGISARIPGQGVWKIDNDAGTIKFTPEPGFDGTPIFPRIGLVDIFNTSGLIYTPTSASERNNSDVAPLPEEMAKYTFIDMQYVMPEEHRKEAEKDHDFNPNTPTPEKELHVTNVEKQPNGDYLVTRNDGETWTIELKDIRDKIAKLEKKDTVSPDDLKTVQDELDKAKKDIDGLKGEDDKINKELDKIKKEVDGLDGRIDKIEDRVTDLENNSIKEVRDNGDGTYTIIRKDNSEVPGKIDTSGSITNIKSDGKGNLIITIDGEDKTVPLDKVKVTEKNKGKPGHTITITTPDGKSITFDAFDNYVTNVEKQPNGDYKVIRNDGTEWTIELKDIRDKIAKLEAQESPSRADYDKIKDELDKLNKKVEDLKAGDKKIKGDIADLRSDITKINNRLITIETRLTVVEKHTNDLTKCVAGAGMATIPALLGIPLMMLSQVNIPGLQYLNTSIQKQIGIYNPELARQWKNNGGVLQAGAVMAGLAGIIGGISYLAKQCDPMMKTPAGKDTDLGKLSSKLDDAKDKSSSKRSEDTDSKDEDK